jgi:hypothetical protein
LLLNFQIITTFFSFFPIAITTLNIKKKTTISLLIINFNELDQKDQRRKKKERKKVMAASFTTPPP